MINQLKPYVEISGSGPDLVLLHGWGLHGGIWQTIVPLLETYFTVHNVDLPGFGHSAVSNEKYNLATVCHAVQSILPKSCYLMGWSLGGVVATQLAQNHPEQIKKLITVASSPCFVEKENWPYGMKAEVLNSFIDYLAEDFKGTLIKFLSIQTMGSRTQKQDIAQLKETVFIHGLPAEKALKGGLEILRDSDLLSDLKELKMPLLRIYGKLDTLVPLKSAKEVDHFSPSSESIIFKKSGHAPFLSETESFMNEVNNFLQSEMK